MKCHVSVIIAVFITVLNFTSGLIRNTNNDKNLSSLNTEFKDVNTCEMQKMAEEMMQHLMEEKDLFTSIMDTLQDRLSANSLCAKTTFVSICKKETGIKKEELQCTSEEYENLISRFTHRKLCHSQIAFGNLLLKSFIDSNASLNAFNSMINNFTSVSECVDDELKSIYKSSMQILTELKDAVINLAKKLWSDKIIEVLKKREHLIASLFCDLRKGQKSTVTNNSLLYENFGIIKIDDESIMKEAFDALSDYYYYFPYFATKLLEKNGMIARLIDIHEKLTTYRAKHLVNKLNEQSKDSVIVNKKAQEALSNYKHFHSLGSHAKDNKSFLENSTEEQTKNSQEDSSKTEKVKPQSSETVKNDDTKDSKDANSDQERNKEPSSNTDKVENKNDKKEENAVNTDDSKETKTTDDSEDNKTKEGSNGNEDSQTKELADNSSHNTDEKKMKENPLYSIESLQEQNIYELLKELIKDLNIVKFENGEPTNYTDTEGIKKLLEANFLDLNNNTMLVRLFIKPQAVILSVIQSFILMTPSPEKDARMYCKKTLKNGKLFEGVSSDQGSEEEDLVSQFASKYNMVYEKIKLEELKEVDQTNSIKANKASAMSALQIKKGPTRKQQSGAMLEQSNPNESQDSLDSHPAATTLAVISDKHGSDISKLIDENVDQIKLANAVDTAYKNPDSSTRSIHISVSSLFFVCVILLTSF